MKRILFLLLSVLLFRIGVAQRVAPQWLPQSSGTTARLRGVSAVSATVAWASGADGVYLKTTDGGETWRTATVPGAEALDFRDVEAFDANTAYLLSIGEGDRSRIYKTTDGGEHWRLQFTNRNPKAFFDAMAFWDADRGLAVSDSVDGRFVIIKTTDGGSSWKEVPPEKLPPALAGEGAFAASGTCIVAQGRNNVWIATTAARALRSTDGGDTWHVSTTTIPKVASAGGIFSIAFIYSKNVVNLGGVYKTEGDAFYNVAKT